MKNNSSYQALIEDTDDEVALLANTSAYLNDSLPTINWVGFYLLKNNELMLGPFQGKVACVTIAIGKGVCGHVAATQQPIVVKDVHDFPGHIACDAASQSEMVLPIFINQEFYGVLDIDAPVTNRFTQEDLRFCQAVISDLQIKIEEVRSKV